MRGIGLYVILAALCRQAQPLVEVVHDARSLPKADGSYSYNVELSDGSRISAQKNGLNKDSSVVVSGEYSFIDNQGLTHTVTYTADKYGFHPHVKVERGNQTESSRTSSTTSSPGESSVTSKDNNETMQSPVDESPLNTISSSLFSGPSNV